MNFRTEVEIPKHQNKIDYSKKIMLIGSCFTDNVGLKFKDYFFDVDINPFGVIYNPESVLSSLETLTNKKFISEKNLFSHNQMWYSYSHHGDFSSNEKETVLAKINNRIDFSSDFLQEADFLFITFGTAWVYYLKKTDTVVANCHKQASSNFRRSLLTVSDISFDYIRYLKLLKAVNPNIEVIFTVSPVRHLKDGAVGNQISKATLLLAINEIIDKIDFAYYFPSYELLMDELRDYRFYQEDMVHISNTAVDFIWQKITETFFDEKTVSDLQQSVKIRKALYHRAFNLKSTEYHLFLENTLKEINELKKKNKYIKLEEAENLISAKLVNY